MRILACACAIAIFIALLTSGASARVVGGDLDNAVAVYYFNSLTDSGNVLDYSGNGLHGGLLNDAQLRKVAGRNFLSLGSNAALFQALSDNKSLSVNKEFSIVAWVKIPRQTNSFRIEIYAYNGVLADDVGAGSEGWVILGVFSSGEIFGNYVYTFNTGGSAAAGIEDTDKHINNNQWQHIGFVINSTSTKLYLNGNRVANESFSEHPAFSGTGSLVFIGYDARGSVDDVGFFNNDLTDAQVKLIYNNGLYTIVSIASVDPSGKAATTWGALKQR